MMFSNNNMLGVPSENKTFYVGDIFYCKTSIDWNHFKRFHGLKIEKIDYFFHKQLWFDFTQWVNNNPTKPTIFVNDPPPYTPSIKLKIF